MAKIISDEIGIKVSRLTKDTQELDSVISGEIISTLEQVVQELVGEGAVVEVFSEE